MQVVYKLTEQLIPYINNARTHSDEQVSLIAGSIKEFGFNNPILLDGDNGVIAGHGRLLAAKKLGMSEIPCLELSHLTDNQKRAYILADNQLALRADWNEDLLKLELEDLKLDFNLNDLGFTTDDLLNTLIAVEDREYQIEKDAIPEPILDIQQGDIYQLGCHRLICGDATNQEFYTKLLQEVTPDIIYTDPPYGISCVKEGGKNKGRIGTGGRSRNGKFYKCTKFMPVTNDGDTETALKALEILLNIEAQFVCIWGGNYFTDVLPPSQCWIIWDKQNYGGMTYADGEMAWTNVDKSMRIYQQQWLGFKARNTDKQIKEEGRQHPNQKPETMAIWAFDRFCPDGRTVLDVFSGSGSTLLACEDKGLTCYAMEYEAAYVDLIIQRWEKRTGQKAVKIV